MYKTRSSMSKLLPIPRKGTRYIVTPSHDHQKSIPLLIAMRDILNIVNTRKELKKIIIDKKVSINSKVAREDSHSLVLFDTLSLKDANKYYRVDYSESGKLMLKEISEKDAGRKIVKVVSKKMLKGKKVQINFNDGRNILSNEKINVGDSALVDFSTKKIEKILPVKEKAKVTVIKGKHMGSTGEISKIDQEKIYVKSKSKEFEIKLEEFIVLD